MSDTAAAVSPNKAKSIRNPGGPNEAPLGKQQNQTSNNPTPRGGGTGE